MVLLVLWGLVMSDIVNEYFKQFYPATFKDEFWEYTSMLGGMRNYREPGVDRIFPAMQRNPRTMTICGGNATLLKRG